MLARLQALPGIADVRVDSTGSLFLVEASREAAEAAGRLLGADARVVAEPAAEQALSRRNRGEAWFGADDIRTLSYLEGRMLGFRFAAAVTRSLRLERPVGDAAHDVITAAILDELDRAHDCGGHPTSEWFWAAWPDIVARVRGALERHPAWAALAGPIADALRPGRPLIDR